MTDIISRLAALTAADDLRGEIITAIKSAPAIRHVEGRHQNALGYDGCEETNAYKEESQIMIVSTSFGAAEIFEIVPVLVVLHPLRSY
jgi:hypothetical protein